MAIAERDVERPDVVDLARRLGEAEQRLRSLMADIGTVVRLTGEISAADDQYVAHLQGRLGAIARAQGMVLARPSGTTDLHGMLADELLAHAAVEERNFSLNGPEIRLGGRAIGILWLVVHELVVNSVKFGALSAREGMISVMWTIEVNGSTSLVFHWMERRGPTAPSDRRAGFGTEMIERRLARELGGGGSLDFTPTGLDCRIHVPVGSDICVVDAI